jgi:hypothetical protein
MRQWKRSTAGRWRGKQVAGIGPMPERATRAECLPQPVAVDLRAKEPERVSAIFNSVLLSEAPPGAQSKDLSNSSHEHGTIGLFERSFDSAGAPLRMTP